MVWGVFLRLVLTLHGTWFVNSAAHTWGYRTCETPEGSRNLWWVGLIAWGEGWHNTTTPSSAPRATASAGGSST